MAEHATIQPLPMNSARSWEEKPRGEGLAPGNRNVYGVPTALLKKSIITSRFTEARFQLLAGQSKRGLDNQSEFRTSSANASFSPTEQRAYTVPGSARPPARQPRRPSQPGRKKVQSAIQKWDSKVGFKSAIQKCRAEKIRRKYKENEHICRP